MRRLFRQFSTPFGVPSHVSPPTPGSIHEGGELGYVLTHAFGAVFDDPGLLAVAIVGDGEAETGPLEGSWKGISFLNPQRDGAVLPILHLNGYKISSPTVLGRKSDEEIRSLFFGHGYDPRFVESCEDWDFWLGAAKRGWTGRCVPEVLVYYRRSAGSRERGSRAPGRPGYRSERG